MAKYTGKNMVVQFIDGSGTITFSAQYRNLDVKWSSDMTEVSTGSDSDKSYLATLMDSTITYQGLSNGTASPLGTADLARLEPQATGTLIYAPLGTASGKPKGAAYVIVKSQDVVYPYADKVEITIEFQRSGAWIYDVNTATF